MNVLLGVSAGIAAYKAAHLTRELIRRGHSVRVVMTPSARDFITPLTLATLSQNPVMVDGFSPEDGRWNSHISLGIWADLMVIAPATANTLAKMRAGIADNLLLCSYLSARCPVVVAPAMDLDMWQHSATQENLSVLQERGVKVVQPEDGFLASGLSGKGRMAEPEAIADAICSMGRVQDFAGRKVLVTAGATIEKIDPVRYISNFSTGKMGRAIASELTSRGAEVILVAGELSAEQMFEQAQAAFADCDIAIFAAAVADYTPEIVADQKIKHSSEQLIVKLRPTIDIAASLSNTKRKGQFTVGFALETNDEEDNAKMKLDKKNLDAIVLNSLRDPGAGFGGDTNKITIIDRRSSIAYDLKTKVEVARDIVDYIKTSIC